MRTTAAILSFWAPLFLSLCMGAIEAAIVGKSSPAQTLHKAFGHDKTVHSADHITIYSTTYIILPPTGTYKTSASALPSSINPVPASFTSKITPSKSSSHFIATGSSSIAIVSGTRLPGNSTASPTLVPLANATSSKGPICTGYVGNRSYYRYPRSSNSFRALSDNA
ncbi:hypothetical protein UA08_04058 [Talaromyces atroroseus]|uniref:Uncharacterized protein n=1 Tax=Talaromyces atroroseus TaxID=1441469 RepID=A0A1Q5Q8B1_TALAT|nr:hypothetical protein UA08_04058 [Talaromyces atroroseus]OKL60355.1 hypothetical protein UA08_04058 [Talaromyces atroroseus]